jgi:hydroxymethylpyrimidine pyrophosphatase-like HAD family hydrolase/energy-coupling factor transporter ATP-binding protein EcfA2
MRYLVLCSDYDGTLATHGRLLPDTIAALERLIASGRRLVMVTGRELPDLKSVCPRLDLFEYVVAENGALLYHPATQVEKPLAAAPPPKFVETLRTRGVGPVSVGRVIVATWEPHETTVLETIRDLGLELQVIFNKGAVMVLPAGVNKATGLAYALEAMSLSTHNAIGVGDAENDHAFLSVCECSVAVSNALPTLKEAADIVTLADHGAGVAELIDELLQDDLAAREKQLKRHRILLGRDSNGAEVCIPPYGENILLVGTSGSGKSTLATGLLERLDEQHYSFCIIDPEGDYETFAAAISLGAATHPPSADEILQLLVKPNASAIVNLVGLPLADRPVFFANLLPQLLSLRARTGRPHWLVIDEAHHLLPQEWEPGGITLPEKLRSVLQITVHPSLLARKLLADINTFIAVGETPVEMLREFCETNGLPIPQTDRIDLQHGQALVWRLASNESPFVLKIEPSHTERRRHIRKYAEGELPPDRSFYFRGPQAKLNLRAHNLVFFLQLSEGVDSETWVYHLKRHDYSRWIGEFIKDPDLSEQVRQVENDASLSPQESRRRIHEEIERRYTMPAGATPKGSRDSVHSAT